MTKGQQVAAALPSRQIAVRREQRGFAVVPETFGQVVEFAKDMAKAEGAIPKHLRGNPGACMAVALQAFEWGMSPFAVANKSYSVNDRIAYEAQLIAAVVNTRSGLQGRLKYAFEGEGPTLRCTVAGILDGEEVKYRSPLFRDITPKNSPLWKSDPEQQISYYSARAWARRHVPEVILGVYDREEVIAATTEPADNEPPSAPSDKKATPEANNVIDVDPERIEEEEPPVSRSEMTGQEEEKPQQSFGAFESLGEYMEGLGQALANSKDEADIEEVWTEFDPMATLEGDDTLQEEANLMKDKALRNIAEEEEPPAADIFRE